ncbi:MAG: diphosphomevalonate decarboxylase, partial [Flavobacteriaceae bacterium]
MDTTAFISPVSKPIVFSTQWRSPSNIALIKYWGKHGDQLPKNPSLSFTLSTSVTETQVDFIPHDKTKWDFVFYFDGQLKTEFNAKLETFFERILTYLPWLNQYSMTIKSKNSFPHSSGIASSASSMSALSLCLMDLERKLFPSLTEEYFFQKASFLARLGSGSASRSIQGPISVWGKNKDLSNSSDLFAVPLGQKVHSVFESFQDTILLVDKGSKPVSSSEGHNLMHGHPFSENRFKQAADHLTLLMKTIQQGDMEEFIRIVELEALTLHAMMMTSNPYFILMKPDTLAIIDKVWEFRKSTQIPLCFTLDAGANVHLL